MSDTVIRVEYLAKRYRLGMIGRTALHEDLSRWWARLHGRPDPTLRVDQLARAGAAALNDDAEHVWALRDVSFDVQRGEVLGIIGRNGAGKSTLLKLLTRVTAPTLGTIRMKGRVASLLEVGTGFHPELTGRENTFLNGAILGMTRAEVRRKFDDIVAFAEIEKFIDTPVKRYSSGMYVRLAFAVAAHLEPEILLVDEVLAVGDQAFQSKCLGKMSDVAREGRTVLFVSHNMGSIRQLCSSVLWLAGGTTERRGAAGDVVAAYLQTGVSQAAVITIEPARHRVVSPFQIETLEIMGADGTPSLILPYGAPVRFRFGFRSSEALNRVALGIEIHVGGCCLTSLVSPPLTVMSGSSLQYATCSLPGGWLCPGYFEIHVGALRQDRNVGLDWVPEAGSFSVSKVAVDASLPEGGIRAGLVRLPGEWSVSGSVGK